jgi:hypothetical protein
MTIGSSVRTAKSGDGRWERVSFLELAPQLFSQNCWQLGSNLYNYKYRTEGGGRRERLTFLKLDQTHNPHLCPNNPNQSFLDDPRRFSILTKSHWLCGLCPDRKLLVLDCWLPSKIVVAIILLLTFSPICCIRKKFWQTCWLWPQIVRK